MLLFPCRRHLWSRHRKQRHSFTQMLPCPLPSIPSYLPSSAAPSAPLLTCNSLLLIQFYSLLIISCSMTWTATNRGSSRENDRIFPVKHSTIFYHIVADCARIGGVTPNFDARWQLLECLTSNSLLKLLFLKVPPSCWVHSSMSLLRFHLIIGGEWGSFGAVRFVPQLDCARIGGVI